MKTYLSHRIMIIAVLNDVTIYSKGETMTRICKTGKGSNKQSGSNK